MGQSKNLFIYIILILAISLSLSANFLQHKRIQYLENCLCSSNSWLNANEFEQIKTEINRLENETKSVLKK